MSAGYTKYKRQHSKFEKERTKTCRIEKDDTWSQWMQTITYRIVSGCKLLHIEWINSKVLLYTTGNYIQYPGINHYGKEYKKECISVYN